MDGLLTDMYSHQAWADAEHWRAVEACPAALEDKAIRERLYHIHIVQHAFLAGAKGAWARPPGLDQFPTLASLKEYGRRYHEEAATVLPGLSEARLAETISVPWFKDPPLSIKLSQALAQAAMHSHYHRGQNATRLRELGGEPPLTDLIVWYWKGRPAPQWA